ncbi:glycosyltransferase family 2 protein [Anaeromicropila herbilytica]|uniref:Glycosyltransferase 2-like domain-containing protein n=1 Tax=Anaeromicropila herbilytica TaxID=2785025 RepID=A0A7R7ICJ1_9FIRM|nr:glycosyltransferase family 2 protein [Anaeromicropila herbilytica]BCN29018.1 hypothetical protein bsdtb5_03130 [Anaeromicropila herbilytica]
MEIVSIIIPVYNCKDYLEDCLTHVIKQTYEWIEVILIDDGSMDSSGRICDDYARGDNRITVYHRKNEGVSASRNYGLEHSSGKYILFVDADDVMETDMVEKCIHLAECNQAELVICSFKYHIIKDNRIVENSLGSDFLGTKEELFGQWFNILVEKEILNPPWNKFIRKDLLDNNHIRFNKQFSICEDMAFSIQVLDASRKTVLTKNMLYNYYLKSSGTLVFKFHENFIEALSYFYENAYGYCKKYKNNDRQLKTIHTLYLNRIFMFINQICTISCWDKEKMDKTMKKIVQSKQFLTAYRSVRLKGKKKIIGTILKNEQFWLIHILYSFKTKALKISGGRLL